MQEHFTTKRADIVSAIAALELSNAIADAETLASVNGRLQAEGRPAINRGRLHSALTQKPDPALTDGNLEGVGRRRMQQDPVYMVANAHDLNISEAPLPDTYTAAKQALAQCDKIDECKDWADKADAMRSYARVSDDKILFNLATRIRARAIRRCGELLAEYDGRGGDRSKSGGAPTSASKRNVAAAAGMSKDQQNTASRVAKVPRKDFDRQVESDNPPTPTKLAEQGISTMTRKAKAADDFENHVDSDSPPTLNKQDADSRQARMEEMRRERALERLMDMMVKFCAANPPATMASYLEIRGREDFVIVRDWIDDLLKQPES